MWGLLDLQQPTRITGVGRHIFPSGNIYEGMFYHDRREGFGRLIWSDGAYYLGNWKRDKRSGKGMFVHANGEIEEGLWKSGKLLSTEQLEAEKEYGGDKESFEKKRSRVINVEMTDEVHEGEEVENKNEKE
jgi:hypothetical protein